MRIDFSTIKEFRVPEGVVTQIADASGRVLWSAVKDPVITIKPHPEMPGYNSSYASVTINGVVYDGSQEVALSLPAGTIITCYLGASISRFWIYDKDGNVTQQSKGTYEYVVVSNATIEVGAKSYQYVGWNAYIYIREN